MTLPNVDMNLLDQPSLEKVQAKALDHPPRLCTRQKLITH